MWYSTINSRAFGRWIASHAAILLGSFCGEDSLKAAEDYLDRSERVNGWKTRKAFSDLLPLIAIGRFIKTTLKRVQLSVGLRPV